MATNQFTWDTKTPPGGFTDRLRDIAYTSNAILGKFCAVGEGPSIITSSDGDTWVEQTHGYTGSYFLGIATNDSIWVAVGGDGNTGTAGAIYTSTNGTTWTDRSPATLTQYFFKVHWDGTNFIAGSTSPNASAWTSPDGITWTARTLTGLDSNSLAYRFDDNGSGRVVCGAKNPGQLWYSDNNGVSWTSVTSPFEGDSLTLRNVIWNGSYFLAGTDFIIYNIDYADGTPTRMITSSDGITWEYEDDFPNQSIRPPQFSEIGVNGSGDILAVAYGGYAFLGSGSKGAITWTELPRLAVGSTLLPHGIAYDGSSWWVVGDTAFIAEGATTSVNIATNPSPATVEFGTIGTNTVSTSSDLTWTGIGSGTHQVYLGTQYDSLVDQGNVGSLETFTPTLAANTSYWWRIDIIDAGTTTGDVWHFVTEPASTQATDQITAFGDSAYTTGVVGPPTSNTTYMSVANTDLIHGHRYFIMAQTKYSCDNGSGIMVLCMEDREILSARGIVNTIHLRTDRFQIAGVFNQLAGESFNYKARRIASPFTASMFHMLCLDLDSPGMEEGRDWFSNHIWINYDLTTSYVDYLDLTFTPDGYSDYLVVANTNWFKYNTPTSYDHLARLYDDTEGEVLAKVGGEIDDSTRSYHQGWDMVWVLRAPEAVSKTLKVQAKVENTAAMRLYGVDIFVLRLNRFKNVAVDQARETFNPGPVIGYMPPYGLNWNFPAEPFIKIDYVPASNGEMVLVFGAESRSYDPNVYGTAFSIKNGGTSSTNLLYLTEYYPPGGQIDTIDYYSTNAVDTDAHVTSICSNLFTGMSGVNPISVFGGSEYSRDTVTMRSLTLFGTEYETAPAVFEFSPGDKTKLNLTNVPITFTIRGTDGVDLDTINMSMHVSDGWKEYPTGMTGTVIRDIAYDGSGVFVAVGTNGKIARSTDGYNWSEQTSGTSEDLYRVAWGASVFVAVGDTETILYSSDGITWNDVSTGVTDKHMAIVYGGGQFVTASYGTKAWTSPDGINWTSHTNAITYGDGIDYNGTDMYCIIGGTADIATSPDGITWTQRATTITTHRIWDVAWGDGRWIAPMLYSPELITSTDGINWSWLDIGAPATADLRKIEYDGGRWVVTGGDLVATTTGDPTDATTWKFTANRGGYWYKPRFLNNGWYTCASNNGSIGTAPNAGYNSNDRPVMVNGEFSTGFTAESTIDELDGYDGYVISIYPEYGVLGKNQLVNISLDADSHTGTSMTTYNTWFHTVNRKLFTMYKTANSSGAQSSGAIMTFTKIDGIIPGHRYLMLYSSTVNTSASRNFTYYLYVDGEENYGDRRRRWYSQDYDVHSMAYIVQPQESIAITGTSWQGSTEEDYCLLIDLDSDPGMFTENDAWFYNIVDGSTGDMDNTWANNEYGSVTFTPDGQSNYLVIADSVNRWPNKNSHAVLEVRVYDSIDGELAKTGNSDPFDRQSVGSVVMAVMEAPTAVERTLTIQHKGDNEWNHYHANIIVIKMDSFASHAHSQTLTGQTGIDSSQTTIETAEFTQDGYGEMLALGRIEYNDGFNINIHYPSGTNRYGNPFDKDGLNEVRPYNPNAYHSDLFGATRVTGLSVGQKQSGLLRTSAYSALNDIFKSHLVLLGTEFYMPPPDAVTSPGPVDDEIDVDLDKVVSWAGGSNTSSYNIYFGTDVDPSGNFIGNQLGTTYDHAGAGYLTLAEDYYWRVDAVGDGGITQGPVWHFTTVLTLPPPAKASVPDPSHDATGVSVDKIVSWTEGASIIPATHNVFFGKDTDPSGNFEVENAADDKTFDPGYLNPKTLKLDASTDYYWRIDEKNVGGTTTGDVWHFVTEAVTLSSKATDPYPDHLATGIIPDENISWTAGDTALSHDVYFGTAADPSSNYVGNQTGTTYNPPSDLTVGETYYWRVDEVNAGGTTTGDVWRFTVIATLPLPTKATSPGPANNTTNVRPLTAMTWTSGTGIPYIGAITHDVYFGTDADPSLNFIANYGIPNYSPGLLGYSETYYWRVDEVSAVSGTTEGDVWTFSTAPMLITEPSDGDKVYDSIHIVGNTAPSVTIHAEVHTDRMISDAFSTSDGNGDFDFVVPFGNQPFGTSIRVAVVTIASPESEETTISLIQGRKPVGPLLLRSGRRTNVDKDTVALWRLGKSVPDEDSGSLILSHNFETSSETTPPSGWSRYGTSGFKPTWADGVMSTYSYSTPGTSSYIARFNDSSVVAKFDPGFRISTSWRTEQGFTESPDEGTQALMYNMYNSKRFSLYFNSDDTFSFGNTLGQTKVDSTVYWNKYEYTDIEVIGKQLVPGDSNTNYLELYVDGYLHVSGYADSTSGTGLYIGNAFSAGDPSFTRSEFDHFLIYEGDPFLILPGANLQGDTALDFDMTAGLYTKKVTEEGVPFDYCTSFNGSAYLESSDAAFDLSGAFTVEAWINADAGTLGSVERVIFGKQALNTSGWVLRISNTGVLEAATYGGSENVMFGESISETLWYHVAYVWDGTNAYIYINGDLIRKSTQLYTVNTAEPFRIGSYSSGGSGTRFDGRIADVRFSNVARDAGEIYNAYYALSDPQEGLVYTGSAIAVLNLDDNPGLIQNHNDYGTVQFRSSAVGERARDFDGSTMYAVLDDNDAWDHFDLSVDVWFSADSLQQGMIVSRIGAVNAGWGIRLETDGTITMTVTDTDGNAASINGGYYSVNSWHYAVLSFDYSKLELSMYLDGELVTTDTMSTSSGSFASSITVDIGRRSTTPFYYFDGAIAFVRIGDGLMTSKQVYDYYNGTNIKEGR